MLFGFIHLVILKNGNGVRILIIFSLLHINIENVSIHIFNSNFFEIIDNMKKVMIKYQYRNLMFEIYEISEKLYKEGKYGNFFIIYGE